MIDTHAHIDDPVYLAELQDFISRQQQGGVEAILVPGVNEQSVLTVPEVCQKYPNYCFPAIGLHPEEVKEDYAEVLDRMEAHLNDVLWIAIGEIGLDYHFDTTYKTEQELALRRQLDWAIRKNLPVMLHFRDATEDSLRILKDYQLSTLNYQLKGVAHCFSGSYEVAHQYVDMGLCLGIGGVLTFKNCKLREHLAGIPLESLILETDAPYMAPVPLRGKTNEPRYIQYVINALAEVYHCTPQEVENITTQTAKRLFSLPK